MNNITDIGEQIKMDRGVSLDKVGAAALMIKEATGIGNEIA